MGYCFKLLSCNWLHSSCNDRHPGFLVVSIAIRTAFPYGRVFVGIRCVTCGFTSSSLGNSQTLVGEEGTAGWSRLCRIGVQSRQPYVHMDGRLGLAPDELLQYDSPSWLFLCFRSQEKEYDESCRSC